jgi:hypothetical protein
MQVNQSLSILFYRKTKKLNKKGLLPLYCRVTIDGLDDEISTSCYIRFDDWDNDNKIVLSTCADHKKFNKKLGQMKTDLQRHFDLMVAKHGLATPKRVFESYQSPLDGHKDKKEKNENVAFSLALDEFTSKVVKHFRKQEAWEQKRRHTELQTEMLIEEKELLIQQLDKMRERGRKMWENREWKKTLLNGMDEYLFNFMELVLTGKRARATFSKIITTKTRVVEFMNKHYKQPDMPLDVIEKSFLEAYTTYIILHYKNIHNTVWKNVQIIKDIMDRAYQKGWVSPNPFALFTWGYKEPKGKKWPAMDDMLDLIRYKFKPTEQELSDLRWCFVFQSFSGLSYAELHKLAPEHLVKGMDKKTWIDQTRKKTDVEETLPLLPICLEILEMFKDDPRCLRSGKCLPVPTNQHYNRMLKVISAKTKVPNMDNCHKARYFFANELAYANGIELRAIGIMLGQLDPRSINTYVKPGKKVISQSMDIIENNVFGEDGPFTESREPTQPNVKVVNIKYKYKKVP